MMEGENWLILEKVFQQAWGGRVTEKWSVVVFFVFSGEKCHFIERIAATQNIPTVTATAAWWRLASNRAKNLAQKRKDMNVKDVW